MTNTIAYKSDAGKGRVRNRILSITRTSIPYIKELRRLRLVKSISACVLMQQLDYWFGKYPGGFYKFLEPCNHAAYKPGKSWTEELEITVDEFRGAFDQIGVRYKSKKEFDEAADKFAGKYYRSYYDKISRLTYYFRNHEVVDADLDALAQMDANQMGNSQMGKAHPHIREVPTPRDGQPQSRELGSSNPDYKETTEDTTKENIQERETVANATTHSNGKKSFVSGSTAIVSEDDGDAIEAEPVFDSKPTAASNVVPATGRAVVMPENFRVTGEMRAWAEANVQPGVDIDRATEKFRVYNYGKYDKNWLAKWQLWMMNERTNDYGKQSTSARHADIYANRDYDKLLDGYV